MQERARQTLATTRRHVVEFEFGGAVRCLTVDEARTLIQRIELAIESASCAEPPR